MYSRLTLTILMSLFAFGCDRKPAPPVLPPVPQTQATVKIAPATKPFVYKKESSIFVVSSEGFPNQQIILPPARLLIQEQDDQFHLTLKSDDPPEAKEEGFAGNRFNFDFTLDVGESISGSSFTYHSSQSEESDENSGLFLQGGRQIALPENVTIQIQGDTDQYKITVSGMFKLITDNPDQKQTQSILISTQIEPEVIHKSD